MGEVCEQCLRVRACMLVRCVRVLVRLEHCTRAVSFPPPSFFIFIFLFFILAHTGATWSFCSPPPLSQVREMKRITDEDSARFRGLPFRSLFVFVATYLPAH